MIKNVSTFFSKNSTEIHELWNFWKEYLQQSFQALAERPVLRLQLLNACRLAAAQGDQPKVSVGGTEQGFGGLVASGLLHHGPDRLVIFGGQAADKDVFDGLIPHNPPSI